MSYILDALRKADAQRERDPARGIHAQPLADLPAQERRSSSMKGAWITAGAVLAAWAAYGVWSHGTAAPPVANAPAAIVAAPSPVLAPAPPAAPANVVLPPAPPATSPPARAVPARPASAAVIAQAGSEAVPVKAAAPAPAAALTAGPAVPVPDAPAASRVYALAELPVDVQRELPKFAISGGVHSDNVAQRMLVVGGQVLNEGSEVAPGVVLEQIRAKTAVLRFRTYRFSVGY